MFQIPVTRRTFLQAGAATLAAPQARPNIVLAVSDDQSWLHTGAMGDRYVRTPAFDRVAREGVLFTHAFCGSPSCAPSRAAMLTGQDVWRLEQGAHMRAHLPRKFAVYPELLEAAGYHVGFTGKGWGPGRLLSSASYAIPPDEERRRNPAGHAYDSFKAFLAARKPGAPFCFWYGSTYPHRPFRPDRDAAKGRESLLRVPGFLPDGPEVRADMADYYAAVEHFDGEVDGVLRQLDAAGVAANTIVAVTSDNGMGGMPRAKCNLYDYGVRMPLAIRWPDRVKGGRKVDDFVSLSDFAPVFLEAGGVPVPAAMTARSLMGPLVKGTRGRDRVFTGRERHSPTRQNAVGYPMRAMRTHEFLYIRNYAPDRWPAGDPPGSSDVDASPTREFMIAHRDDPSVRRLFDLAFAKRPAEELYDVRRDPDQLFNVAGAPSYRAARQQMARELDQYLKETGDPRALGRGGIFDTYPFWSGTER